MPKTTVSHRLDDELLTWATAYAKERGSTRSVLLEEALVSFRSLAEGGVPDLPEAGPLDERRSALPKIVRASKLAPADAVMSARQARLNRERS